MSGPGGLRGGPLHRFYSVLVFIVLASLDNVAIGLVPPLYDPISQDLGVPEGAVGAVTAVIFLVTAIASVGWAYLGDRTDRKRVLIAGTLLWVAGMLGTAYAPGYLAFLTAQLVGAVGLGAVASVGFSVVSDLISPRRRGLVMSLWGLSQGVGTLLGTVLGGLLGAGDWRRPFLLLSGAGVAAVAAYVFTWDVRRGQSEPELAALFAAGGSYEHRITAGDLAGIAARRSNVWLVLQGVTAQLAFGSLVWLPRLFQARLEAQGFDSATAVAVGSVYATLFQLGGVLSILGGLLGDRLSRRTPAARPMVAAVGIVAAVPFYLLLFFAPFHPDIAPGVRGGAAVNAVLGSLLHEPTVAASFLAALLALALTSANSPNWLALIADVNPPEQRGTVYSAGNLANGVGRAVGNGLAGAVFGALRTALPAPANYAVGLAAFQVFFLPTGLMYWLAARRTPADVAAVRTMLRSRSIVPVGPRVPVGPVDGVAAGEPPVGAPGGI